MRTLLLLLLISNISFGQMGRRFQSNFDFENEIKKENKIDGYTSYDFSTIWTKTKNSLIQGIIGADHKRIRVKIITVEKNKNVPNKYIVSGKSMVSNVICDFTGIITIKEIKEYKEKHFGVDEFYKNKGIIAQGVVAAEYDFKENTTQKHSGSFKGKLYSKWYVEAENKIIYDDIESGRDSYINNAFIGTWKSYTTNKEKICNWADHRVPNANEDFDIGAGEFSPADKYLDKGWANYRKAWFDGDEKAREIETKAWWK